MRGATKQLALRERGGKLYFHHERGKPRHGGSTTIRIRIRGEGEEKEELP